MKTPATLNKLSNRQNYDKKQSYDYSLHYKVNKLCEKWASRCGAYNWFWVLRAACGYFDAVELGNGFWNIYYRNVL